MALGNLLNFLVAINAACNFLLYCVLSDKYRQTVKDLVCHKLLHRQGTLNSYQTSRSDRSRKGIVFENTLRSGELDPIIRSRTKMRLQSIGEIERNGNNNIQRIVSTY